jgi:serine/threonine-protein kinase
VIGSLAVPGALAYVALRPEAPSSAAAQPAVAQRLVATPEPIAPEATRAAAATAMVKMRVNTDPDGASVREDGVELCSSTPCDLLYKGPDADPSREHKLTLGRPGYRSETRSVKVTDSPVTVKLAKAEAPRVAPQAVARPEGPALPSGYKTDVPY